MHVAHENNAFAEDAHVHTGERTNADVTHTNVDHRQSQLLPLLQLRGVSLEAVRC